VQHVEGLVHGFLSLRSPEGRLIASGDLNQNLHGDRVTSRLTFHFKDGSLSDETAIFSQHGRFLLVSDHLVQKGPAFQRPLDMTIDRAAGRVTVRYRTEKGEDKVDDEKMDLPEDLANGLVSTVLKNVRHDAPPAALSFVVATPSPRLIKVKISVAASDPFSIAGAGKQAVHYVLHPDLGGLTGVAAKIFNKQPPDAHVWILEADAPAFLRSRSQFFMDSPLWQIDQIGPTWPSTSFN
jgi:hypothetical protein